MYSAVIVAAVTLALSCAVYSLADFQVSPSPVYSVSSFSVYGSPSLLHLQVNSTARTAPAELRIDNGSSLSGILELTASGYSETSSICGPGSTTFFSVRTGSGTLSVSGAGTAWIDGRRASSALVEPGFHELIISNGAGCSVSLPGGGLVSGPSAAVSSIPVESMNQLSYLFFIPYYTGGHVVTVIFDGGTEVVGF